MSEGMNLDPYTCAEALDRLYEYLDRELPPSEHDTVQRHLATCESCFQRFEFDRQLLERIQEKCRSGRAPASVRARVTRMLSRMR